MVNGEHLVFLNLLRKVANAPELVYQSALGRETVDDDGEVCVDAYNGVCDMVDNYCVKNPDVKEDGPDGAVFLDPSTSGKLSVLKDLLTAIKNRRGTSKVVIVSHFTKTLDVISRMLKSDDMSFVRLDGSTPKQQRMQLVDRFNSPVADPFAFLMSTKSGGVGLNLIGAAHLILLDSDWNPSHDEQAMARIWRDGQEAPQVSIYRLLTSYTIDESIFQRQVTKLALSHRFMSDANENDDGTNTAGSSGDNDNQRMTLEQMREMARLKCQIVDEGCLCHSNLLECKCGGVPTLENFYANMFRKSNVVKEIEADASTDPWIHLSPVALQDDEMMSKLSAVDDVLSKCRPDNLNMMLLRRPPK